MMLQIVESGRAGQMIESIARMIVDAGYKIVGEGIETPALMERARESGFGYLQGYHLGRPARPPAAAPLRVPGTRTLSAVSRGSRR
ncbi:MAG: EAL domain-containing protein, partial [Thioalkalivibrio sp.]|nr:EAL domain-containing protein [Thioalkalivibrio sp.]